MRESGCGAGPSGAELSWRASIDAEAIEDLLRRTNGRLGEVIRVNRSRLRESHEAWVHGRILGDEAERGELALFAGVGLIPGVGC